MAVQALSAGTVGWCSQLELTFKGFRPWQKAMHCDTGPPSGSAVHLCVDMQRMFTVETAWKMPWLVRVLPNITTITASHPEHTIFTRFIPAQKRGQGVGMWRRYYER
jgi:hypothetical protein